MTSIRSGIAALLIATGLGIWLVNQGIMNTSSLPVLADIGTDFELTAADGVRIRLKDYRDRIVIVLFGYTSCPDVCPTSLYTLKQVMDKLGEDSGQVQVLLITVDPERDSSERLKEYVSYFHRDFIGLTGTLKEITGVAKAYLTEIRKEPPLPDGGYQVSHSAFFYLLDRQGRVRALHDPTSTPAQIAADVRSLLAERKGFI
ncbi:MAG: SCO family protein [Gammaproteobacteria bacterium]|nr:MAG: SCO family protein [Gammaproteobacteria bacterium]